MPFHWFFIKKNRCTVTSSDVLTNWGIWTCESFFSVFLLIKCEWTSLVAMFSTTVPSLSKFWNEFFFFIISNVTECFECYKLAERAFEMCVIKAKGKIHVINMLVWHIQPNTLSRQKLLSVGIMFLKKQLEIMLEEDSERRGQCESWFESQQAFKERWSLSMCDPCEKSVF